MILSRRLTLVLCAVLLGWNYLRGISDVPLHLDESTWIDTSAYFEHVLTGGAFSTTWDSEFDPVDQPPVAKYLIGIGRRLGGYNDEAANLGEWDQVFGQNISPDANLLWWCRLPMALCSIVAGLIGAGLLLVSAGSLSALVFTLMFTTGAPILVVLRRATGDPALVCFTLLSMAAACAAFRGRGVVRSISWREWIGPMRWLFISAAMAGLAGASKLNGLSALGGTWVAALYYLHLRADLPPGVARWRLVVRVLTALGLCAFAVFVFSYPYLYWDTLDRIKAMLDYRVATMHRQASGAFGEAIPAGQRWGVICRLVFQDLSLLRWYMPAVLNPVLTGWGVFMALFRVVFQKKPGEAPVEVVLVGYALAMVLPTMGSPLAWERYFVFPVLFSALFMAYAAGRVTGFFRWRKPAGFRYHR